MSTIRTPNVPHGYFVTDSPNEDENGTLSCPHHGCDGFSFNTAEECHEHESDWHAGPYCCGRCGVKAAARPALGRHEKKCWRELQQHETEQEVFVCEQNGCAMQGIKFTDHASYRSHALESSAHDCHVPGGDVVMCDANITEDGNLARAETEEAKDEGVDIDNSSIVVAGGPIRTGIDVAEEAAMNIDSTNLPAGENDLTHPGPEETKVPEADAREENDCIENGFMCTISCCRQYKTLFGGYRQYYRHILSQGHGSAEAVAATLFGKGYDEEKLEEKRAALRDWRCDAKECAEFARTFSTGAAFYHHIQTVGHLRPNAVEEEREARRLEKIREKESRPTVCTVALCPRFQHHFTSPSAYRGHVETAAHQRAAEYIQSQEEAKAKQLEAAAQMNAWKGVVPLTPPKETEKPGEEDQPVTPSKVRHTGVMGGGLATPLASPPGWREVKLERENRKLEEKVRELEAEIERCRQSMRAMGVIAFGE